MKETIHDALLVVVAKLHEAERIQRALIARAIPAEIRRRAALVEFGGMLGESPYEIYVRSQDLGAARSVLDRIDWTDITAPGVPFRL